MIVTSAIAAAELTINSIIAIIGLGSLKHTSLPTIMCPNAQDHQNKLEKEMPATPTRSRRYELEVLEFFIFYT